jgi:hypothetical protein
MRAFLFSCPTGRRLLQASLSFMRYAATDKEYFLKAFGSTGKISSLAILILKQWNDLSTEWFKFPI